MDRPEPPPAHRPFRWLRFAARTGLLAWAGFWTWFIVSVMTSEPPAIQPVLALALLWTVAGIAWFLPRAGCGVLLAFAAWSVWFFRNDASVWLIALPASAIAVLGWLGARGAGGCVATAE